MIGPGEMNGPVNWASGQEGTGDMERPWDSDRGHVGARYRGYDKDRGLFQKQGPS